MLKKLCDFLITETPLTVCDVIVVLAGKPERKSYGVKLFQQGLAPRLVLSVSRFDVRSTATLLADPAHLFALRDASPPNERHFWAVFEGNQVTVAKAKLEGTGTYAELEGLGAYLAGRPPASLGLVSTSIHLRRIRFCCSRIRFFAGKQLYLWPVPEELSAFPRRAWWKHAADWLYLISEYVKLAGYRLIHRR
jgi:hypothetical protein